MNNVGNQDKMLIKVLWCSAYTKVNSSIYGMKNYSSAWIIESTNHWASNITGHAASAQHKVAMLRLWTQQVKTASVPIAEHCPIIKL